MAVCALAPCVYVPYILEILNYFETVSATQERLLHYNAEKVCSCQHSFNSGRSYIPTICGGSTTSTLLGAWSYECTATFVHGTT
jgi:hypothetical protein